MLMYRKKRATQYGSSEGKAEDAYSVDSGSQSVTLQWRMIYLWTEKGSWVL